MPRQRVSFLASVLKKKPGPQKPPKSPPDRRADLLDQFGAATTGRGFDGSPTPARGKPTDRSGGHRPWPRPGSLEPKPNEE
jgi:hypothetical protein